MFSRRVFDGDVVTVHEVWCGDQPEPATELEEASASQIVLPHHGAFVRELEGRRVVATAAVAVFFNAGDTGRILHPLGHGDASTVLTPAESTLEHLLTPAGRLPIDARALSCTSMLGHSRLRHLLGRAAHRRDHLAVEEEAIELMTAAVGTPIRRPAISPTRRQALLAERVASRLAADPSINLSLSALAEEVGASVFEVSRAVSRVNGAPITLLRATLRLRHALKHLDDDGMSLSQLASESGYADQSHMTRAFGRHLGVSPAEARRRVTGMSRKIVQDSRQPPTRHCHDGEPAGPAPTPDRRSLHAAHE